MMDIGVLTSESEGFSNSILEYMAAGLPVLCFNSGGNQEIINENVNGFLLKNTRELADKIVHAFDIQKLYNNLLQNNLKDVQGFKWENSISQIEEYYIALQ